MTEVKTKKERIASFDLIRAICPFLIVIYHFSMEVSELGLPYVQPLMQSVRFETTLFFMISGASLMLSQGGKFDLKMYAKKRFLAIFPLFYIVWLLAFAAISIVNRSLPLHDVRTLPLTLFGLDGLLSPYLDTWYMTVGEWFLGALVICYVLFPLLLFVVKRKKGLLTVLLLSVELPLGFLGIITVRNLLVSVTSFVIGMELYHLREFLEKRPWISLITAPLTVLYMVIVKFSFPYLFSVQVVAFLIFVTLMSLEAPLKKTLGKVTPLKKTLTFLSGLSYPMFLIQHLAVRFVVGIVPSVTGNGLELLLLVLVLCVAGAFVLNTVYRFLSSKLRLLFQRKSLRAKGD